MDCLGLEGDQVHLGSQAGAGTDHRGNGRADGKTRREVTVLGAGRRTRFGEPAGRRRVAEGGQASAVPSAPPKDLGFDPGRVGSYCRVCSGG